ncbi:MAG: HAD family hydrolase [Trueperaceae bacterium]
MIQGVIFDVGGTLIYANDNHFEPANAWSAATFLRSKGFNFDAETFARELVALRSTSPKGDADLKQINTTSEHLQLVAKRFGLELSHDVMAGLEHAFITPEALGATPLPGIQEVVKSLVGNVRLGVISNTRSHLLIEETVKHLGLLKWFDPFVTSVSTGYRKPSPRIFQTVLDAWKLPPETIVMIGDAPSKDVVGAKAVGMKTIWLRTDATETDGLGADATAETPSEILKTLEKM